MFYKSEEHGGRYAIWWCQDLNYPDLLWNIGNTNEKGQCKGWGANLQDSVCPQSLFGYTWWLAYDGEGWQTAGRNIAIRCVLDDENTINGPKSASTSGTSSDNVIPSI